MNHHCPDEETLAAYFDGLMPAEEEAALHAELLSCPDCVRLVATLGLVLEVEPADAWQQAACTPRPRRTHAVSTPRRAASTLRARRAPHE